MLGVASIDVAEVAQPCSPTRRGAFSLTPDVGMPGAPRCRHTKVSKVQMPRKRDDAASEIAQAFGKGMGEGFVRECGPCICCFAIFLVLTILLAVFGAFSLLRWMFQSDSSSAYPS